LHSHGRGQTKSRSLHSTHLRLESRTDRFDRQSSVFLLGFTVKTQNCLRKLVPVKRWRIPGLVDRIEVNSAREISNVLKDSRLDREFRTPTALINWLLLKRALSVLSFAGRRFPTMMPRASAADASERDRLWERLDAKVPFIREGPEELEPLARAIKGNDSDDELGMRVQQVLGGLFSDRFVATRGSWEAAQILVAAPRSSNAAQLFWWAVSGKVRRAKRLLASMVDGDLSAVNAIGIAVHNVVRGLTHMRRLYSDVGVRSTLSAQEAADQCLFAPLSIFRQATAAGEVNGCPFSRHSLFVLNIGEASRLEEGRSLVFVDESWSRCPAGKWVPAMLEGVWRRALNDGKARH